MRRRLLISPALLLGAVSLAFAPAKAQTAQHKYSVKADPAVAPAIDHLLAQIAEPAEVLLPAGEAAADYLQNRCLNPDLASIRTQAQASAQRVRYTPCVAFRRKASVKVKDGDTLSAIAARLGLRLDRAFDLKVSPRGDLASAVKIDPKNLKPSETVIAEKVPAWTPFTVKAAQFPDRDALVARFAEALGCQTSDRERCLLDKHIFLRDAGPVTPAAPVPTPAPTPAPPAQPAAGGGNPLQGFGSIFGQLAEAVGVPAHAVTPAAPPLPQSPPPPAAAAAPTPAVVAEVASGQWPYDIELIKRTLEAAAAQSGNPEPAVLGIADAGLASADGSPLSANVFVDPIEEDPPGTEAEDDNGDGVWNDRIGAGVTRPNQPRPDGDVGLCPQAVDYSTWSPSERIAANHGAIVASIAAGLPLRTAAPSISPFLPRIAFFRLVDRACDKRAGISAFPSAVGEGFEFLVQQSDIVNVSYLGPGDKSETMASTIGRKLQSEERLLIIPAGNDLAEDLDQEKFCPACIVSSPAVYGLASRRVIVVGAADASLRRTSFSGFGRQTVQLYAPAEPFGAIDIAGNRADYAPAATSYSAPLVTLAAGLMRTLGIKKVWDISNRLYLASWPLLDDQGHADPDGARVIDLTRAAAVRQQAIEVFQSEADGRRIRRTYVGKFADSPDRVSVCGSVFTEAKYSALIFGEARPDGQRKLTVYKRMTDPQSHALESVSLNCTPTGNLNFVDLRDNAFTIAWAGVAQVLFRWTQAP